MKSRCYNKNSKKYQNYGARGIAVCDKWKNNFKAFYNWALKNGYEYGKGLSIDRINNDKEYSPNNCRIVTMFVQSRNTTRNLYTTINGEKLTIQDLADRYDLNSATLRDRYHRGWRGEKLILPTNTYHKDGWSNKQKITLRKAKQIKKLLNNGFLAPTIARRYEVDPNIIYRIKNGLSWKDA